MSLVRSSHDKYLIYIHVSFQNFKREEQNFVVQNEINNMSFLISDTKCKMSKVGYVKLRGLNIFKVL